MTSRWHHLKQTALALRRNGASINSVELQLGIPRSTLSGWFKHVQMNDSDVARLQMSKERSWAQARLKAAAWHRAQKQARLRKAQEDASAVMSRLPLNNDVLDLALAMLYLGEGAKNDNTSIASSDPKILRFTLTALERVYGLARDKIYCELHLRMDQNKQELIQYWSSELRVPIEKFGYVAFDKRSAGKSTYDHYKGVCVLRCGNIAIQRKLMALYNLFCERVATL